MTTSLIDKVSLSLPLPPPLSPPLSLSPLYLPPFSLSFHQKFNVIVYLLSG